MRKFLLPGACLCLFLLISTAGSSQRGMDSIFKSIDPQKFFNVISSKTEKYYQEISNKTEKTLEKLAKWEEKVKSILEKTSPETASRLFNNTQLTFAKLLEQYKTGKVFTTKYTTYISEYKDKLNNTIKYIEKKKQYLDVKVRGSLKDVRAKLTKLDSVEKSSEALQQFIKERKRQLIQGAMDHIGKSKYLQKIDKNAVYYFESLRNFKATFSDPAKAEQAAVKILQKIPAFSEFIKKNSFLASLFRMPASGADPATQANLSGLQTRMDLNNIIQQTISAAGPNAQQVLQQSMQYAQTQMNELKDKFFSKGGNANDLDLPSKFKYNSQRAKKFWDKWELGVNIQNNNANNFLPLSSDLGISAGYRPNEKFVAGLGLAGRIGWGQSIRNIDLSYQGISARFFSELKLKGSFHATAGFEMNYRTEFRTLTQLQNFAAWQRSGLIGVTKIISLKSKFFKKTKMGFLWDFLSYEQIPRTQPIIFRIGYSFK